MHCFARPRLTLPVRMTPHGRPPSLEDKRQFRSNMYKITSDQLGEIVQTLEQQCPEALAKVRGRGCG